jgi:hypothetical protein
MSGKSKILFIASNPNDLTQLNLDEEIRSITMKIQAAEYHDVLDLISIWAVRPDDLLQQLNIHKPNVVHFSGHGSKVGELVLMDDQHQTKKVAPDALKALFSTLKDNIRLVVLNACYSKTQAEAISEVIDCVVGMNTSIGDQAAITFAGSFYRAIGFGRSVKEAFDQAKTSLMLESIPEEDTPELLVRSGVDPASVYLLNLVEKIKPDNQTILEKTLSPLSLAAVFVGLVVQTVETVLKVGAIFGEHRFLTVTAFWVAAVLIAWRGLKQNRHLASRNIRVCLVLAATVLYLVVILYPHAMMWFDRGPAPNPRTRLSSSFPAVVSPAHAAESGFEIIQFYPDDQLSSFEEVMSTDFSKGQGLIRSFEYNRLVEQARMSGRCVGVEGERPIKSVLPLLDERLKRMGQVDLLPYVRDIASYKQMMSRGGSTFLKVTFTEVELSRMRIADPAGFKVAANWLVNCVGVEDPVITVVLRNNSAKTIVLSEVHYLVEKAFVTLGGYPAAITPAQAYDHVLPHKEGDHRRRLNPPFKLEGKTVGSLNLVLRPDVEGPGLSWTMRIAVLDTDGNRDVTERFQLIMSKKVN